MKVLVTGAKGFVGSAIVKHLESFGDEVWSIENQRSAEANERDASRKNSERTFSSARTYAADITDEKTLSCLKNIGTVEAVVHAAGLAHQFGDTKREVFQKVNVAGTCNVLQLAKRLSVRHFVLISSVSVYGNARKQTAVANKQISAIEETGECAPDDFYAESKLDAESAARRFCQENQINLTVLRLATVVGEEDRGNFLRLIEALDRRRFVWVGTGENHKTFVHREDVAAACRLVLTSQKDETALYNVAADYLRVKEIVEIISGKLGKKPLPIYLPAIISELVFRINRKTFVNKKILGLEKTISKWLAEDVYSAEKIKREYGFAPQIGARRAVEREVEWYLAQK